jgi:hypothetical protein
MAGYTIDPMHTTYTISRDDMERDAYGWLRRLIRRRVFANARRLRKTITHA